MNESDNKLVLVLFNNDKLVRNNLVNNEAVDNKVAKVQNRLFNNTVIYFEDWSLRNFIFFSGFKLKAKIYKYNFSSILFLF
jgi:hypothetical protein